MSELTRGNSQIPHSYTIHTYAITKDKCCGGIRYGTY
jgi:hypothetical protein